MGIHTMKFIAEIQKRPCLWNTNLENYNSNKLAKQQAWDEVAQTMFENWSNMDATFRTEKLREIQKKWKGLRDYYGRARNSGPKVKQTSTDRRKRRKAPSLKMLQFLSATKPEDNIPQEAESEGSDSSSRSSAKAKARKVQVYVETEEMIKAVQTKPCIWNINLEEYSDKDLKQEAWMEIATILYADFLTYSDRNKREVVRHLQKKWKGLRDYFTRQKTKERMNKGDTSLRKRRAPYLTLLQFLDIPKSMDEDSQDASKAASVSELTDTMLQGGDTDASQASFTWPREKKTAGKRQQKKSTHRNHTSEKIKNKRTDPDMNFLLNILPDMKSMTRRQNFDFRFEVMKLIKNIKYNQPSEYFFEGTPGSSHDTPVFSWHTSGTDSKAPGKPPFRHQVIIQEYPKDASGDMQSPLSHDSAGSSVEDIKAILQETSEEQSD